MEMTKLSSVKSHSISGLTTSSSRHLPHLKKKKKQKVTKTDQEIEDPEETKRKNQRYMNVLKDLSRLRDYYYSVYLNKLEAKVDRQRKELKAKEEKVQKKLLKEELEKAQKAHQVVHRLSKVNLTNDTEYLRKVPKSRYYHLVAVEELMKSRGLLKRKFEVEDFWTKAKSDQSFWIKPIPKTISPDTLTEHMLSRYSSLTSRSKPDPSVVSTKLGNSLERLPAILKRNLFVSNEKEEAVTENGLNRSETPPLIFPEPPKFPNLHSFDVNLAPKSSYARSVCSSLQESESAKESYVEPRKRHVQHHLKRDAYEVAVVNTAMSKRLLRRHALDIDNLKPISEITEMWCSQSDAGSNTSSKAVQKNKRRTKKGTTGQNLVYYGKTNEPDGINATNRNNLVSIKEEQMPTPEVRQPLSLDLMLSDDSVCTKDVKCRNKFWLNYADDPADDAQ